MLRGHGIEHSALVTSISAMSITLSEINLETTVSVTVEAAMATAMTTVVTAMRIRWVVIVVRPVVDPRSVDDSVTAAMAVRRVMSTCSPDDASQFGIFQSPFNTQIFDFDP